MCSLTITVTPPLLSTPATPSFCCLVSCLGPWVGLFAFVMPTPTWPDCHLWTKDGRLPTESPIGFKPLLRVRPAQGSHRRGHQGLDGQVVGVVDGSFDRRQGFPAALSTTVVSYYPVWQLPACLPCLIPPTAWRHLTHYCRRRDFAGSQVTPSRLAPEGKLRECAPVRRNLPRNSAGSVRRRARTARGAAAPFAHNMLIWRNRSTSRLRCCLWRSTTVVG